MKAKSLTLLITTAALALNAPSFAGNKDRNGQAGATELLINPWARSTGVFGLNTAFVSGVEAMKGNIAGLAFVTGTDIAAAYSVYLRGSDVNVSNIGFGQRLGNFGVLGVNILSMSFGEINVTTDNNPGGDIGTYKPQFFNVEVGFAKEFSDAIHAGIGVTLVSEQISNIKSSGAAFEAGVMYQTGKRDNFHFGVTLRNVGTNMKFSGEGLAADASAPEGGLYSVSRETPTQSFQMPTYLNIGLSYDFFLDEGHLKNADDKPMHRLTAMAAFTSNSFNNDNIGAGLEYSFRDMFMLRGAYRYEKSISDAAESKTFYTGISAGAGVSTMLGGDGGPRLSIDYSYRPTVRPANGVHTFTLRLASGGRKKKTTTDTP